MRKLKRILTSFLAVALVLSNLSFGSLTVNAAEVDDTGTTEVETGTSEAEVEESNLESNVEQPENQDVSGNNLSVSENEPAEEQAQTENTSVSENSVNEEEADDNAVVGTGDITFSFAELTYDKGQSEIEVDDAGKATITYTADNQSVFITIPETISGKLISKVTFNLTSDNAGSFAYKVFAKDTFEADKWGAGVTGEPAIYGNSTQIIPEESQSGLGYLSLMAFSADTVAEITGITFTCEEVKPTEKTYSFAELTYDKGASEIVVDEAGKATITYTADNQSVFITIPDELSGCDISKITYNLTSDNAGSFAYKVFAKDTFEADKWGAGVTGEPAIYGNSTQIIPEESQSGLGYVSLMAFSADTVAEITGITFTYKKGSAVITYGDNIIKNPNFAEEDMSVWGASLGESTISQGTDADIIASIPVEGVTSYGVISGRTSNSDCFAQDVTAAINGDLGKYSYEFYAMLSDDYEGAADDQKYVTFGPYTVIGDATDYNVGQTDKQLTPGEWTKFEGTFTISSSVDKAVIRIVEQGERSKWGSGEGVKGDYYVTGVSVKKVNEPKVEIEKDIPDWKDSITDAFGPDAIAGTCLGTVTKTIDNETLQDLAKKHFNAITFENEMKPDAILGGSNPKFDEEGNIIYQFATADSMLNKIKAWNDENADDEIDFKIRGHVLVWHSQTPDWFFHVDYDTNKGLVTPDVMNQRMEAYIAAVFEHFVTGEEAIEKGWNTMFYGWDVVNEAINDNDGLPRTAETSKWAAVYGNNSYDYILKAFEYAYNYAPYTIELYYNDYNECGTTKSNGIASLLAKVQEAEDAGNARIDGMGMQAHHNYADPTASQIADAARKYADALDADDVIQLTELDVKASSAYQNGNISLADEHAKQAWRFKEIFDVLKSLKAEGVNVDGITMWGITDNTSWLQSNNSVGGASQGGTHAPLLFDANYKAKPAFWAFVDDTKLEPMINEVTFLEQIETDSFVNGLSYDIAGNSVSATFVPMWNEDGYTIKVDVTDATNNGENDTIALYLEEGTRAEGDKTPVATVTRSEATSTDTGYSAVIDVEAETAITKTFIFDIAVTDGADGSAAVFNDKKGTQAATSKYYADAILKPYATAAQGTAVVDGQKDEAYLGAEVIPMTIRKNAAEADASAQVMWDDDNLYVYAQVKDAVLDKTGKDAHEQDSLEIFVDVDNAKSGGYQNDDAQYRINYVNELSINTPDASTKTVNSVAVQTTYGYAIEASFAWDMEGFEPAIGDEIGLELQINDAKGGERIGTLSWYDTTGNGWSSPSVYGTVKLVDNAEFDAESADLGDVLVQDLPMGGVDAIPDGLWIAGVNEKPYYYTGAAVVPEIRVYDHKTLLKNKVDYTITCKDNKKVSTATKPAKITVKGKGNYTETVTEEFMILAKNLNDKDIIANDIEVKYTGSVQKPNPVVTYNGKALKKGTDYTVTYPSDADYKSVGEYTITITGKGGYVGTRDINLSIDMYMSAVTVGKIKDQKYNNGEPVTLSPLPTVKWGSTLLKENVDFTVSYRNNEEVGTATLVLTAKEGSGYIGTKEVTFKITGTSIAKATVTGIPKKMPYSGSEITAATEGWGDAISIKVGGVELDSENYTVGYDNNTNAGKKATVIITGNANKGYSGTIKKTFEITPYDFKADAELETPLVVTNAEDSVSFLKSGAKAKVVSVTYDGTPLVEGKDYKVSYKNNKKLHDGTGTNKVPTVTITGMGNFKGNVSETFAIVKQDIGDLSMTLVDKAFSFKKNAYKSTPKVFDKEGKALTTKDYTDIKYTYAENAKLVDGTSRNAGEEIGKDDFPKAGTKINVTVTGQGNYDGTLTGTYKISTYDLSKTKVTIKDQIYTGKAIELNKATDITVKMGDAVFSPDSYEIVSYKNNVKTGKATVVLQGTGDTENGDLAGSKTVTFKIKSKGIKGLLWWLGL